MVTQKRKILASDFWAWRGRGQLRGKKKWKLKVSSEPAENLGSHITALLKNTAWLPGVLGINFKLPDGVLGLLSSLQPGKALSNPPGLCLSSSYQFIIFSVSFFFILLFFFFF